MKKMKNLNITIILILNLFIDTSCAQNKPTNIDIKQLSVGKITYKTSITEIKNILGAPLSHKKIEDPDGEYGDTPAIYDYFEYRNISVDFIKYEYMDKKEIINIEVKSDSYPLKVNEKSIKLGDDFKKIRSILPYEYDKVVNELNDIKKDKNYSIIGGNLQIGNIEPSNIVFTFRNKKIIRISVGFPR